VDHADAIQHNAELVDELDLTMSFAQVAVDNILNTS
jgi:DNA mismatch repair ATPase MutS